MFVATVAEVVAAFFRSCGGAIAVNDRQIEKSVVMKLVYRAREDNCNRLRVTGNEIPSQRSSRTNFFMPENLQPVGGIE